MYTKWMDKWIKTRVLTGFCCAGSDEEGVMENVKRDKNRKWTESGWTHAKNKSTYCLWLCR